MVHGTVFGSVGSVPAALVDATWASSTVSTEKKSHSSFSAQLFALVRGKVCQVHTRSSRAVPESPGVTSTERTSAPSNRISCHADVRPARMVSCPATTLLSEPVMEKSAGHSSLSPSSSATSGPLV